MSIQKPDIYSEYEDVLTNENGPYQAGYVNKYVSNRRYFSSRNGSADPYFNKRLNYPDRTLVLGLDNAAQMHCNLKDEDLDQAEQLLEDFKEYIEQAATLSGEAILTSRMKSIEEKIPSKRDQQVIRLLRIRGVPSAEDIEERYEALENGRRDSRNLSWNVASRLHDQLAQNAKTLDEELPTQDQISKRKREAITWGLGVPSAVTAVLLSIAQLLDVINITDLLSLLF